MNIDEMDRSAVNGCLKMLEAIENFKNRQSRLQSQTDPAIHSLFDRPASFKPHLKKIFLKPALYRAVNEAMYTFLLDALRRIAWFCKAYALAPTEDNPHLLHVITEISELNELLSIAADSWEAAHAYLEQEDAQANREKRLAILVLASSKYKLNIAEGLAEEARAARQLELVKMYFGTVQQLREHHQSLLHPTTQLPEDFRAIPDADVSAQLQWLHAQFDDHIAELYTSANTEDEWSMVARVEEMRRELDLTLSSVFISAPTDPSVPVCQITSRLIDAIQSSGNSKIVDGTFSTPLFPNRPVKVKLSLRENLTSVEQEFRIMHTLHDRNQGRFVKPYELVKGWETNPVLQSSQGDDLREYCGIVMERGQESLADFLHRQSRLSHLERLSIGEKVMDIVIAAHDVGVVLMDLKPANIIRCLNEDNEFVLKAVDFGASRRVGEPIDGSITPQYGSFEVAKFLLAKERDSAMLAPSASPAMDVCAVAWIVWRLSNQEGRSLWDHLGTTADNRAVLVALASMTDISLERHIVNAFPDAVHAPLKHFLGDALRVEPSARPPAANLKHNYSLFGHREGTIDINVLVNRFAAVVEVGLANHGEDIVRRLIDRIDTLSEDMKSQFRQLHTTIDREVVQMACNNKQAVLEQLTALLDQQRSYAARNRLNHDQLMRDMRALGTDMNSNFARCIARTLTMCTGSSTQGENLDAVLMMLTDIRGQLNEIRHLENGQLDLLAEINNTGVPMPHLFCIVPEVRRQRLDRSAPMSAKVVNCLKRMAECTYSVAWSRSRLIFICPITLQMVPCGNDGRGYLIDVPNAMVQRAAPIIKAGFLLLKIALATQGLGAVLPNIADFLPSSTFGLDVINDLLGEMGDVATDAAQDALGNAAALLARRDSRDIKALLTLMAREEGIDFASNADWTPTKTGLVSAVCRSTGEAAWVSAGSKSDFQRRGKAAFGTIVQP